MSVVHSKIDGIAASWEKICQVFPQLATEQNLNKSCSNDLGLLAHLKKSPEEIISVSQVKLMDAK